MLPVCWQKHELILGFITLIDKERYKVKHIGKQSHGLALTVDRKQCVCVLLYFFHFFFIKYST